jgi:hypothetical protein
MISIPSGTKVTCSRKGHPIGLTFEPLKAGDPLRFSALVMVPGQERIQGEHPKCKIDGSVYFLDGKIHTDQGWMPGDPRMDPVKQKKDFSEKRDRNQGKSEAAHAKNLAKHRKDKKEKKEKDKPKHENHP